MSRNYIRLPADGEEKFTAVAVDVKRRVEVDITEALQDLAKFFGRHEAPADVRDLEIRLSMALSRAEHAEKSCSSLSLALASAQDELEATKARLNEADEKITRAYEESSTTIKRLEAEIEALTAPPVSAPIEAQGVTAPLGDTEIVEAPSPKSKRKKD